MFAFNDAWVINETLALHVSTNTFSNPTFDQDHIDFANSEEPANSQPSNGSKRPKREDRKKKNGQFKSSFADSLAFSIRSKLFVIDLNFKRKLQSLKAFAVRHFPGLFETAVAQSSSRTSTKGSTSTKARFMNRTKIHDCDEQFWDNIMEPNSRKSLGKQKEKILNRLERALEQKRNQPDYECQQQRGQNAKTSSHRSLGPNSATTDNGLRHIRPGIVGHPLYSDSQSSSSSASSSSRTSSASLIGAQSSPAGGEPIIIGSQSWARRQQQRNCHHNKARNPSKWKQIRDLVFDDGGSLLDEDVDEPSSKKLCIVCYTNTPNIVTLPCKHHDVCSDCFIEMIYIAVKKSQYPLKCALCRQKVEKIRCSRKLLLSVIEKQRIYP